MRKIITATAVALLIAITSACSVRTGADKAAQEVTEQESSAVQNGVADLGRNQPIPQFDYSQIRQTVIEVETAQATGAVTTSAFYLEGVGLVEWCPSIGVPVAATTQLSNPTTYVDIPGDRTYEKFPLPQPEPTGVYPGDTSATYVLCVDDNGKPFAHYWEGYTVNDVGVREYPADKRVTLVGDPTMEFSGGK